MSKNTVKYFTDKNCHKAGLTPDWSNSCKIARIANSRQYWYKDILSISQCYTKGTGVTLTLGTGFPQLVRESGLSFRSFDDNYYGVPEIDVPELQNKLDSILEVLEEEAAKIATEEKCQEYMATLRTTIEEGEACLKKVAVVVDWLTVPIRRLKSLTTAVETLRYDIEGAKESLEVFPNEPAIKKAEGLVYFDAESRLNLVRSHIASVENEYKYL